jgi:hypothetical protein
MHDRVPEIPRLFSFPGISVDKQISGSRRPAPRSGAFFLSLVKGVTDASSEPKAVERATAKFGHHQNARLRKPV